MNRRFRILLSGAFALLAVVVCAAYAGHVRDEAEQVRAEAIERYGGEVMSLVVANSELPRGHVVSRSDVTVRDWLLDLAPEGAETSLDDVVGLEVTNPVPAGSPLTALSFREESDVGPVPDGYVALSVPLGERLGMPGSAGSGERLAAWRVTESGAAPITGDLLRLGRRLVAGARALRRRLGGDRCPDVRPGTRERACRGGRCRGGSRLARGWRRGPGG